MASALKITPTDHSGLKRGFTVVIPADILETSVDKELSRVGRTAKIAGFRPGKVPPQFLRQKYGASVMGEVVQNAVNDASREVLETHKLTPALQPDIQITQFEEGGDLSFTMDLEVMPESPEIDLSKIALEKPTYEVSDEEVNQALERIAQGNRALSDKPDGAAEQGDVVQIDFEGFVDDVAFAGGKSSQPMDLELGSGQFIPGFEEQLIGAKAGDARTVKVAFPADYHASELAGKDARFEVTVHKIRQHAEATIDDEFAKRLGMASLDKVKDAIRSQIQKDYDSLARNRMKKALFDQLEEKCDFSVPEGMLKLEFGSIWEQVGEARKQGDPAVKDRSEDDLKAEYEKIALRRVRLGIFLSQTAGRNDLSVNQQDLQKAMFEQARNYPGQERQILEFYQKHPEQLTELRGPILEEKAVDFILGKVKLEEKKIPLETLIAEQQQAGDVPHVHDENCNH